MKYIVCLSELASRSRVLTAYTARGAVVQLPDHNSDGQVAVFAVPDADTRVSSVVVDLPPPPRYSNQLAMAGKALEWFVNPVTDPNAMPREWAWLEVCRRLLDIGSGFLDATRTITMQIREDEGIVVQFDLFNI